VARAVSESGLAGGVVALFTVGSTVGLTTIEFEPGAVADLGRVFEKLAPRDAEYQHELRWHDDNGHSHVRAALLGPSLVVPFVDRSLTLGTWQQIVLVDFDTRPRQREVVAQMMGE
jgi:secondary thiamine-phosphate synthase enzyme